MEDVLGKIKCGFERRQSPTTGVSCDKTNVFLEFYQTITRPVVCGSECRTLNKKRGKTNESCRNENIEVDTMIELGTRTDEV